MDKDELRAWLRLGLSEGVGNDAARRLLTCFGNPQTVFEQSDRTLRDVVTPAQALALRTHPTALAVHYERTQHWLQQAVRSHHHDVWPLGHAHYPVELLQLTDPPLMLYVAGQTSAVLGHAIAIVGSRNPTPQGLQNAEQFGQALRAAGLCVVSGLALGVDGAAHQGALRVDFCDPAQWCTVAVVGTGLDRIYPRQHQALAQEIASRGLLISEYPLGTPPLAQNFPKRNRLIAALGLGTLVVEAALKSGSLITANMALDLGREVLAIPGSIHAPQSHGCHALIRQGAKLVETAHDVLEELRLAPHSQVNLFSDALDVSDPMPLTPSGATEHPVLTHMGFAPVSLDALQARSGMHIAALQAHLLTLELDGQVGRMAGGLFQRLVPT